jgi:hypothetical protein
MLNGLISYWPQITITGLFLLMLILNRTVFFDREVRPVKDHIEEGWERALDESYNENQAHYRSVCIKFTWFLVLIVLILSIFR